jgi:hypothetical protein
VSGQLHAPATSAPERSPRYPLTRRLGGPQSRSGRRGEDNILDSNSDPSVVQPVASRYTDCDIPAPDLVVGEDKIKVNLKETCYEVVEWIERVSNEVWWQTPVDPTMTLYKLRKTCSGFSRRTLSCSHNTRLILL